MLGTVEPVSIWRLSGRRTAGSAVAGRLSERESGLDGVPVGCSGTCSEEEGVIHSERGSNGDSPA